MSAPDDTVKKVTLGGKEYGVPPLSARRIVRFTSILSSVNLNALKDNKIDPADLDRVYEAAFVGISQGFDPPLRIAGKEYDAALEDFMEGHVTVGELMEALGVITEQAGMEAPKPGEAEAPGTSAQ